MFKIGRGAFCTLIAKSIRKTGLPHRFGSIQANSHYSNRIKDAITQSNKEKLLELLSKHSCDEKFSPEEWTFENSEHHKKLVSTALNLCFKTSEPLLIFDVISVLYNAKQESTTNPESLKGLRLILEQCVDNLRRLRYDGSSIHCKNRTAKSQYILVAMETMRRLHKLEVHLDSHLASELVMYVAQSGDILLLRELTSMLPPSPQILVYSAEPFIMSGHSDWYQHLVGNFAAFMKSDHIDTTRHNANSADLKALTRVARATLGAVNRRMMSNTTLSSVEITSLHAIADIFAKLGGEVHVQGSGDQWPSPQNKLHELDSAYILSCLNNRLASAKGNSSQYFLKGKMVNDEDHESGSENGDGHSDSEVDSDDDDDSQSDDEGEDYDFETNDEAYPNAQALPSFEGLAKQQDLGIFVMGSEILEEIRAAIPFEITEFAYLVEDQLFPLIKCNEGSNIPALNDLTSQFIGKGSLKIKLFNANIHPYPYYQHVRELRDGNASCKSVWSPSTQRCRPIPEDPVLRRSRRAAASKSIIEDDDVVSGSLNQDKKSYPIRNPFNSVFMPNIDWNGSESRPPDSEAERILDKSHQWEWTNNRLGATMVASDHRLNFIQDLTNAIIWYNSNEKNERRLDKSKLSYIQRRKLRRQLSTPLAEDAGVGNFERARISSTVFFAIDPANHR